MKMYDFDELVLLEWFLAMPGRISALVGTNCVERVFMFTRAWFCDFVATPPVNGRCLTEGP